MKNKDKDIEEFEKKNGKVKYAKGVMKKFGLEERVIKIKPKGK